MTLITGDEYFPGGMGQFKAKKNEFLVFEEGPTVDVTLQWATYRDASDQCSLSRIWGGIHPPVDDIPGRIIGKQVGIDAYNFAIPYFTYEEPSVIDERNFMVYPNPVSTRIIYIKNTLGVDVFNLFDIQGKSIPVEHVFDENFDKTHGSFVDTAAVMQNMDLIISVDTAIAHLAGAMAKPVWLLLPWATDWRWLEHKTTSPWYPTMRIFKQPKPFDWKTVMHEVYWQLLQKTTDRQYFLH